MPKPSERMSDERAALMKKSWASTQADLISALVRHGESSVDARNVTRSLSIEQMNVVIRALTPAPEAVEGARAILDDWATAFPKENAALKPFNAWLGLRERIAAALARRPGG